MIQNYTPEIVYGGTDGIITTFAVVSGSIGLQLNPVIIISLAVANVVADGLSMATGSYLSEKSRQHQRSYEIVALITFFSFVLFGLLPLLPYAYSYIDSSYTPNYFHILFFVSISLFIVGTQRSTKNKLKNGFITMIIGTISSFVAYTLSESVQHIL